MKIFNKIILILSFLFLANNIDSFSKGNEKLDTLLYRLTSVHNDTNKIKLLNDISFIYYSINPDSGIEYGKMAIEIAEKLDWEYGIAEANQNLGINNSVKGNYDEAIKYFSKSLEIYKSLKDKEKISRILGNLGAVSMNLSNFTSALDYYQQALEIDDADSNAARQLGNIGLVYINLKDYNKALDYNLKALKISKKLNDKDRISKQLSNIGLTYSFLKDYTKALEFYEEALSLDEESNNSKGQAIRLGNIGVLYWNLYDYAKAFSYYNRALLKNEDFGSKSGVAVNLGNLGELYFRLTQDSVIQRLSLSGSKINLDKKYNLAKSIEYSKQAEEIASAIGTKRQLIDVYHILDKANQSVGNYKEAYKYQSEWAQLKDSIFSVEKTTEIANLEARKENEIKEKELKVKDLELLRKNNEQYVMFAGLGVIAIILVIIVLQRRKSEKLLLNILPVKIAKRLKKNEKNIADRFDEVSIVFVDIVGFTIYSKGTEPEQVVSALNDIFTRFDILSSKHGLEKIKTIGDCYMAVAGLPEANDDHAYATAQFALEAKDIMHNYVTPDGHKLMFRIGIDSGPVVAGVIGESKFSYDLWGDAVNMASRMESTGLPNEIQVTKNFLSRIEGKGLDYKERGEVNIKGKGIITTYLLK